MEFQKLRLSQVDRAVKLASAPPRPSPGWIQTIRTALGMTTRQLAGRLGVSQSTLTALEKSEAEDRITLQSLRRAAEALDCELQYVLVPRSSLKRRVEDRAQDVAHERVARVWHSMRLEEQAPLTQSEKREISKMRGDLLDSNWKQLWD
jgi:predicted DNA-binding mobile mystery protein A